MIVKNKKNFFLSFKKTTTKNSSNKCFRCVNFTYMWLVFIRVNLHFVSQLTLSALMSFTVKANYLKTHTQLVSLSVAWDSDSTLIHIFRVAQIPRCCLISPVIHTFTLVLTLM